MHMDHISEKLITLMKKSQTITITNTIDPHHKFLEISHSDLQMKTKQYLNMSHLC